MSKKWDLRTVPPKLTNNKKVVKQTMSSSAAPRPASIVGRSLLVSDDSEAISELTKGLQQFAISTDICGDAQTAASLINTRKFEAIVVDFVLGSDMSGILERVRLSPSNEHSVTFALVSPGQESDVHVQPNFILRRPLTENAIGSTLKAALGLIIRDYRRYFRCPVNVPIVIQIENKAQIRCEMINVSEGGLALTTPATFTAGALVRVEFRLPGESESFRLDAEICWCDHKDRAGLHFRAVPREKQLLLQSWLSRKIEEGIPEPLARHYQKQAETSAATEPH